MGNESDEETTPTSLFLTATIFLWACLTGLPIPTTLYHALHGLRSFCLVCDSVLILLLGLVGLSGVYWLLGTKDTIFPVRIGTERWAGEQIGVPLGALFPGDVSAVWA